jgi:hypothetical protein
MHNMRCYLCSIRTAALLSPPLLISCTRFPANCLLRQAAAPPSPAGVMHRMRGYQFFQTGSCLPSLLLMSQVTRLPVCSDRQLPPSSPAGVMHRMRGYQFVQTGSCLPSLLLMSQVTRLPVCSDRQLSPSSPADVMHKLHGYLSVQTGSCPSTLLLMSCTKSAAACLFRPAAYPLLSC